MGVDGLLKDVPGSSAATIIRQEIEASIVALQGSGLMTFMKVIF